MKILMAKPTEAAERCSKDIAALLEERHIQMCPVELAAVLAQFTGLCTAVAMSQGHDGGTLRRCVDKNMRAGQQEYLRQLETTEPETT